MSILRLGGLGRLLGKMPSNFCVSRTWLLDLTVPSGQSQPVATSIRFI